MAWWREEWTHWVVQGHRDGRDATQDVRRRRERRHTAMTAWRRQCCVKEHRAARQRLGAERCVLQAMLRVWCAAAAREAHGSALEFNTSSRVEMQ